MRTTLGGPISHEGLCEILEQVVRERDVANRVSDGEWRYSDQEPVAAEAAICAMKRAIKMTQTEQGPVREPVAGPAPQARIEHAARAIYDAEPFYMPTGQMRDGIEIARKFSFDEAPAYRQRRALDMAEAVIRALERSQPAPLADADGWIEWKGGECPVPSETLVKIKYRDGHVTHTGQASGWVWTHDFGDCDIIAYRIATPAPQAAPDEILAIDAKPREAVFTDPKAALDWLHTQPVPRVSEEIVQRAISFADERWNALASPIPGRFGMKKWNYSWFRDLLNAVAPMIRAPLEKEIERLAKMIPPALADRATEQARWNELVAELAALRAQSASLVLKPILEAAAKLRTAAGQTFHPKHSLFIFGCPLCEALKAFDRAVVDAIEAVR